MRRESFASLQRRHGDNHDDHDCHRRGGRQMRLWTQWTHPGGPHGAPASTARYLWAKNPVELPTAKDSATYYANNRCRRGDRSHSSDSGGTTTVYPPSQATASTSVLLTTRTLAMATTTTPLTAPPLRLARCEPDMRAPQRWIPNNGSFRRTAAAHCTCLVLIIVVPASAAYMY